MTSPEGKVKEKIDKLLKGYAPLVWYFKPVSNGMGKHGIPDYIICCKGLFIGVEAKSGPDKKPTARQKLQLNQILAAGGVSMVIHSDNLHELEDLLAETVRGYA